MNGLYFELAFLRNQQFTILNAILVQCIFYALDREQRVEHLRRLPTHIFSNSVILQKEICV